MLRSTTLLDAARRRARRMRALPAFVAAAWLASVFAPAHAAAQDVTPDPFGFPPRVGVQPESEVRSEPIVVRGIDAPAAVTVSGGLYSINGAAPAYLPGSAVDGDEISLVATAPASYSTTLVVTLTVGTESAVFELTTGANNPRIVAEEFSGDNAFCLDGGVRLRIGIDVNGDEQLAEDELRQVAHVCNGRSVQVESHPLAPDPAGCPQGGVEIIMALPGAEISAEPPSVVRAELCHGTSSLVRTTPLEAGDETCPNGGVQVQTWLDLDGDAEPSPGEVASVQNVCSGLATLVDTTALPTDSAECPKGGLRVRAGLDADGDGSLDEAEASQTALLCHGRDALLETAPLEPSAECPNGGISLVVGTDSDGDGTLQPAERTSERALCRPLANVTRTLRLPTGSEQCAYGGTLLQTGLDANGDGLLDDAEVLVNELICNGLGLAVRSSPLAAGVECPAGGAWLESGVDLNGDGQLGDDEVQARTPVCGAARLLLESHALGAGAQGCSDGAIRLISGHDDGSPSGVAGDGVLQDGEIEVDRAVCQSSGSCSVLGGLGAAPAGLSPAALALCALALTRLGRRRRG